MSERVEGYERSIKWYRERLSEMSQSTRMMDYAAVIASLEQARYWAKRSERNEELPYDDGLGDGCPHMLVECVNGIPPIDRGSTCIICPHRDKGKSGESDQ